MNSASSPNCLSRRVLWKNEGIPDNHTDDETFLKELRTNVNLRTYTYREAVCGATVLVQQISLVVFFVIIYALSLRSFMSAPQIIIVYSFLLFTLYFLYRYLILNKRFGPPPKNDLQTFVVIYGFAFGVSPILSTLTGTVSTDSIYTMVAVLLLLNLIVHDYGPQAMVVSQAFSLNAAFGAAVCLASRLPSSLDAFALVICAVGIFGLWPAMRSLLKKRYPAAFPLIAVGMVVADGALLSWLSTFWLGMFAAVVVAVGLLCPALFVYLQRWKTTIHGPWDEAVLKTDRPVSPLNR
ncbi:phosphatidylinositol N-acetylglucosaminyltransferase subunit C-like [Paramacrobiotus metropolitanus]|uniref:phosphatidylinositol N-acetylglucosaminyltransferase subunit C-like n=1 Tax=Paramacrobiotus metropolitanus TaxID=2943436 RepID=UPI002445D146|nr:phosphatidylinositol N-acetylglucosaminyltransferase subunit C-like [Paramacrobiotus metropolitanus]